MGNAEAVGVENSQLTLLEDTEAPFRTRPSDHAFGGQDNEWPLPRVPAKAFCLFRRYGLRPRAFRRGQSNKR